MTMETSFDFGINCDIWSDENGNLDQTIDDNGEGGNVPSPKGKKFLLGIV